ncbi:MAG: carboxymuconolactone decarboxylase family protein [Burkholderiaceae bacterium]
MQDNTDQRRFKLLTFDEMTQAQRELAQNIQSGPRSAVAGSAANASTNSVGGPFNVFLRSPELGDLLQKMGSYLRFKSCLGMRLNELAILMTARHWTAQYEWFAHQRLALQAGLSPDIAEAIAQGQRPSAMQADEEIIYNFCQELHSTTRVSDASYQAVLGLFGEQGVVELIGVSGYYSTVAMMLNVDQTPIPGGIAPPLAVLK